MTWQTIDVQFNDSICRIRFNRPDENKTINALLINECTKVLTLCEERNITVVIFEGSSDVFCVGADFSEIHTMMSEGKQGSADPDNLYALWLKMATGPFITLSHVQGQVNAGGMGFIAASDIVISGENSLFSLSELLFGLYPACVLPFLIRKIGFQKAHYLTIMTKPIPVKQAFDWGLVDAVGVNSNALLQQHLQRLKRLPEDGIKRYKYYMSELCGELNKNRKLAVSANIEMFSNPENLKKIYQFMEKGIYPWES